LLGTLSGAYHTIVKNEEIGVKWFWVTATLIVGFLVLSVALGRGKVSAVNLVGSTSVQPFAEMLSQEFNKQHPDCLVDVQGGGSTQGLRAVDNRMADIGMCSRALTAEEMADTTKNYRTVTIARDGLAIVVHPSNPIADLSIEQVRKMFAGDEITNWSQVGGPDAPIRLITREEGSGTREAFTKMVMGKLRISRAALTQESNGSVKELVRTDPCAIGYMSLGLVKGELNMVRMDGVQPTVEEVLAGRYPLVRPFLFVTYGQPGDRARRFIDFVLSPRGQKLLQQEGLVPAK
jgi:phosphate transport system substrate-binding protein